MGKVKKQKESEKINFVKLNFDYKPIPRFSSGCKNC